MSLLKLNPDWNVTVYDDEMIDTLIESAAHAQLIMHEEATTLVGTKDSNEEYIQRPAHIVERSDIARLLLMYTEGGFYIDADRLVNKRLYDVISINNTRLCLPTFNDVFFCQDLQCTSPNNNMFLSMIQEASSMRLQMERRQGWIR